MDIKNAIIFVEHPWKSWVVTRCLHCKSLQWSKGRSLNASNRTYPKVDEISSQPITKLGVPKWLSFCENYKIIRSFWQSTSKLFEKRKLFKLQVVKSCVKSKQLAIAFLPLFFNQLHCYYLRVCVSNQSCHIRPCHHLCNNS